MTAVRRDIVTELSAPVSRQVSFRSTQGVNMSSHENDCQDNQYRSKSIKASVLLVERTKELPRMLFNPNKFTSDAAIPKQTASI